MKPSLIRLFAASCLACVVGGAKAQPRPQPPTGNPVNTGSDKLVSAGTFADSAGQKHSWEINTAHALRWDGKPYLPTGGTFAPKSFASDTDAAWQADVKALETLKSKGLHDILILPEKPLIEIKPQTFQKLTDWLDANEFRYGVGFGQGIALPLSGAVIRPAYYRYEDPESLTATWQVNDADSALTVVVDASSDNRPAKVAPIAVKNNVVTLSLEGGKGRTIALLYPHKILKPHGEGTLPDVWSGFDSYRDRLLAWCAAVKWGKGLRFFHDPLAKQIGLLGETDYLVPDSTEFRLEFESYLLRTYPNVEELKQNWGVGDGNFRTHAELARLIPLWTGDRGIPYFFNPIDRKTYRTLDGRQSRWWADFLQYRNDSIQYYMNVLATLLKQNAADVPVVVTWTQTHPIFLNKEPKGYDGLSVAVSGRGETLLSRTLGPAYSEAEQGGRTLWCFASQIAGTSPITPKSETDDKPASQDAPTAKGVYSSRNALFGHWDELRRIGLKGFFADGFQTDGKHGSDWLDSPAQLDWMKEYAIKIESESKAADYAPPVLFFPQMAPGPARIGMVPGSENMYWLNAFAGGETLDYWPAYRGYVLRRGENDVQTVLVSLNGQRKTRLWTPNPRLVQAFAPNGQPIPVHVKDKSSVEVILDTTPTVFRTSGQPLVPYEAADDALMQLGALLDRAYKMRLPAVDGDRAAYQRAKEAYKLKDLTTAYGFARGTLESLILSVAPYIWIEGENPFEKLHTFNEIASHVEASGGEYLRLNTPFDPPRFGYGTRYQFDVPQDGRYTVWLAGSLPGPGTSPIRWRVNNEPEMKPVNLTPQGETYLNGYFGWIQLGTVTLKRGAQQKLSIYAIDRAASPADYVFSIDAICLTMQPFDPHGTQKPLPVDPATIRALLKDKNFERP